MRFRLTPTNDDFYQLFGEAGRNLQSTVGAFKKVLGEVPDVADLHQDVKAGERRGDELTRAILRRLDTSFVTPFDREDIHGLAEIVDDVVDGIYHVSELLVLMPVERPLPEVYEQVDVLEEMSGVAADILDRLDDFKGVRELHERLDTLESKGDLIYRRTLARLYSGDLEPLEVIMWKDVILAAEDCMDKLEDLGDMVASIIVKHA